MRFLWTRGEFATRMSNLFILDLAAGTLPSVIDRHREQELGSERRAEWTFESTATATPTVAFEEDQVPLSSPVGEATAVLPLEIEQDRKPIITGDVQAQFAVEWVNVVVRAPKQRLSWRLSGADSTVSPTQRILNNVSKKALPGELMVLMGPSGAGKSTLLDCLAGRSAISSGKVTINGRPWNSDIASRACYVMQDDLFYANLSVLEHLTFQAQLRMSVGYSETDRQRRVSAVIHELGLEGCCDTRIGDPVHSNKGLSGGQRKRLSLAGELLTNPSLLFVDEPTSGLDSFMAEQVVIQMRQMAQRGRTIITTIHQPSSQLFACLIACISLLVVAQCITVALMRASSILPLLATHALRS